ncbi:MAG: hypothetical protein ABIY52_16825, partial [Gemmatimonadaceae bacterium]
VAFRLGPAIAAIITATSAGEGKGSVAAGIGDGEFTLKVVNAGATIWNGAVPMTTAALWLAGPPLLLWLAWLATRPRRGAPPVGELYHGQRDVEMQPDRERIGDRDAR